MKLALKQKVFSLKEAFTVMDEAGEPVYEVSGKLLSVGHKLTIRDMDGGEAAWIHQKVLSLVPRYFIGVSGRTSRPESPLDNPVGLAYHIL